MLKGSKQSQEARRKMSISMAGRVPWNKGKKGRQVAWNKGKAGVYSKEVLESMSRKRRGIKLSEETKKKMSLVRKNERHPGWKGDGVKYRGLHSWVARQFGKPTKCEHCGRVGYGRQIHWASRNHEYKREISDWFQLCSSCHGKYDRENNLRKHYQLIN